MPSPFSHCRAIFLCAILWSSLAACTAIQPESPIAVQPARLRFANLTILDALPLYVAQEQGHFQKHGVEVELIPVASAPERDQLIASGQADGMINEVLSTILNNREEIRVQVVRYARTATPGSALFRILTSKQSGITTVEELKGVGIGVSDATIIEYLTDRLLQAEGLTPSEIEMVSVPRIPDRLALLANGELDAGVLPDPLASLAMLQGATNVLDDTSHPEYSFSCIAFRKEVLDDQPQAVRAFLAAIEDAVAEINKDPNRFRSLLLAQKVLPEPLAETFAVPEFVTAGIPSQAAYADVLAWAKDNNLLDVDVPYANVVTAEYLP